VATRHWDRGFGSRSRYGCVWGFFCVGRDLPRGDPPVKGVIPKCLKGFILSEVNSESGQDREPNPWNVQQVGNKFTAILYGCSSWVRLPMELLAPVLVVILLHHVMLHWRHLLKTESRCTPLFSVSSYTFWAF